MAITCCNGCKPPKRNGYCHATCPEYAEQKGKHDAQMEQIRKDRDIQIGISNQKFSGVRRADKRKKNHKGAGGVWKK